MRKFLRNLLLALIPVAVINALCWGTLVYLAWQDDLTYVNYASALDKEKRLEELGNQSRLLIIGGSNARFGFDSSILRDTLHLEPVNMGIHIGLGLNYMFEEVYDHLRKGDVLLVSAEYNHFLKEGSYYGDEGLTDMYLIKHELGAHVDLRFYNEKGRSFHPKSNIFHYADRSDIYIGSSNISRSALTSGIEWNYRFSSRKDPDNYKKFYDTFEDLFENHSIVIDDEELRLYAKHGIDLRLIKIWIIMTKRKNMKKQM